MDAFDAAISDGVDVLSVSLSGEPVEFFGDGVGIGAFQAVKKGIFIVNSAGNEEPDPGTLTNCLPGCSQLEFVKLSAASGVMLWLENLYYKVLILMTGNLENAKITVDALSIWSRLVANPFKKEVEELQMELRKYLNCSQATTASVAYTPSQDHEQYRQADKYSLVETISACSDSGDETTSFSHKDDIENIACSFPEINVWVGEHVERAAKVCIDKEERILLLQRSLEDAQRMIVEMEMKLSSLKGAAIALNENQDCLRHSCFAKESRFWILRSKPKISKKGLIQSLIVGMALGKIYRSSSLKLKHEQGEELGLGFVRYTRGLGRSGNNYKSSLKRISHFVLQSQEAFWEIYPIRYN
ncbi:hypothetical protein COLO4_16097 [Corchorus olitorius]|uniref:Peptidase S8/S53 domain-containing protein n=1 Tax=Corchorus olitorius TaxID=93759 RepID=A0A1R3JJN7_9ROSI|nr:hypothetical protein COLO4_16097 [Corchorus olitorius]